VSTLDHGPHGTTESGAAYMEAARRAEATAPARLLGVAQVAIETALRLTDPDEIHTHLAEALGRIKNPEAAA
jgi:hypothetical protein